ncbi:MAG: ribosome biogenesis GTPase Der [Kiritimatiellae bacterium]|nr:ribosome biogenesis GTPase Der [Kiritimatiellia bacterium]
MTQLLSKQNTSCAVAIVGRPNVGKSSIFNRLAGRRVAIVHAERGVTRDRLMREVLWNDRRFELIDTGGLGELEAPDDPAILPGERLEALVRRQVEIAVQDAAAIIFVTDVEAGALPQDAEVAAFLRRSGKKIFVAANKADTTGLDAQAAEFAAFGFAVFPVSATHNRGFKALMAAVLPILPEMENSTQQTPLRVAIVGRPNVGKSSFINRLLQSDRVIVSAMPGTTRDSVEIPFVVGRDSQARHYVLIDTAGIRRAGKISETVERFSLDRSTQSIERADVVALVLNATQGPTAQDKTIASLIQYHRKGCLLLITKWDLMTKWSEREYRKALGEAVPFLSSAPAVFVSAKTGFNIRRSIETMDNVAAQIITQLPTGLLNRTLIQAYERVAPPFVKGKRLKIFYATQVGIKPITILLFVNDPTKLIPTYEAYLVNTLRKTFGLEGAPVIFQLKQRHAPAGKDHVRGLKCGPASKATGL